MIHIFRRKPKIRPYPAVYAEWMTEFGRINQTKRYLTEQDKVLLSGGVLMDSAYTQGSFKKELTAFLEGQMTLFFEAYSRSIDLCMQEADPHYLVLTIRRYTSAYQALFFFQGWDFLAQEEIGRLTQDLAGKLTAFHQDLLAYIQTMSEYTTLMTPVITHIRRLI